MFIWNFWRVHWSPPSPQSWCWYCLWCVCCSQILPSFSSDSSLLSSTSFLSSAVVNSTASSSVSFFFFAFVYSIQIVNSYGLYRFLIRMVHRDWQFVRSIWIVNPYEHYGLSIRIRSIHRRKKMQTAKLTVVIAERRRTPMTSTHWLMKMNHRLKRRRWENLRGLMKNMWMNGVDTRIPNPYFTFKHQWRRGKIGFSLKMLSVEEMVLGARRKSLNKIS